MLAAARLAFTMTSSEERDNSGKGAANEALLVGTPMEMTTAGFTPQTVEGHATPWNFAAPDSTADYTEHREKALKGKEVDRSDGPSRPPMHARQLRAPQVREII